MKKNVSSYFFRRIKSLLWKIAKKLYLMELYYKIMIPFSHEKIELDLQKAREALERFSPPPSGKSITRNDVTDPFQYDLQIIVPAYNAEKYLEECIDSILHQKTKYSYKIMIIDDGSTDRTGEIADKYSFYSNVQVIHQENGGSSKARNAGLNTIFANYICFVDSDDKMQSGAIEALMEVAVTMNADIVQGGYYDLYGRFRYAHYMGNEGKMINAMENLPGFLWGKVYKSNLFFRICFPEGFLFQDSINLFLIFPQAENVYMIPDFVYGYRQGVKNSISHLEAAKPKCLDTYWITERLMNEHEALGLPCDWKNYEVLLRQFLVNGRRLRRMPKEIRKSAFALMVELMKKYTSMESGKYKELENAVKTKDFGAYDLYCKTH